MVWVTTEAVHEPVETALCRIQSIFSDRPGAWVNAPSIPVLRLACVARLFFHAARDARIIFPLNVAFIRRHRTVRLKMP